MFLCLVSRSAVARPIEGGAGQVLRAGQERATAPHAAVPRLVSTRQLCKFLSLQVVTAFSSSPPHSLGETTRMSSFFIPFLSLLLSSQGITRLLLICINKTGQVASTSVPPVVK